MDEQQIIKDQLAVILEEINAKADQFNKLYQLVKGTTAYPLALVTASGNLDKGVAFSITGHQVIIDGLYVHIAKNMKRAEENSEFKRIFNSNTNNGLTK